MLLASRLVSCLKYLAVFWLSCWLAHDASAEEFTLVLTVKTGNVNNAGTDDPIYFALHYVEMVDVPAKDKKQKTRQKPEMKRVERGLDNPGNDRRAGAIGTYHLKFNCPLQAIKGIEIGMKAGDDAWFVDGMQYYIESGGKKSQVVNVPAVGWVSAAVGDGTKRFPSKQFYMFPASPPRFPKQ